MLNNVLPFFYVVHIKFGMLGYFSVLETWFANKDMVDIILHIIHNVEKQVMMSIIFTFFLTMTHINPNFQYLFLSARNLQHNMRNIYYLRVTRYQN